ncbi:hypothetical protein PanWU01x14_210200 [Parasponia andersonii]|uniref:Uncharacterized protein n=1 Tax=Parasponia andersonii TaxID=3476 RepID=A0A2P5BU33_PARAD|nr:hypothetical protein PanWU01x14_210200 [Parasponia andersonii]
MIISLEQPGGFRCPHLSKVVKRRVRSYELKKVAVATAKIRHCHCITRLLLELRSGVAQTS